MRLEIYYSLIFLLLALPCGAESTEKNRIEFQVSSYSHSPIAPVKQIYDDLKGPKVESGDFAFSTSHYQLNWHYSRFSFGVFERADYYLKFTPDTAELVHADKNDLAIERGQAYDIYLHAEELRARGLQGNYHWQAFDNIQANIGLSYLKAFEHIDGDLRGELFAGDEDVTGELHLDYTYTEDVFFNRPANNITGEGYSVDIELQWLISPQWKASFFAQDLVSRIYWNDQYSTIADANTDSVEYNEDGLLDANPTLTWTESARYVTQKLPNQYRAATNYRYSDRWTLDAELYRYDTHSFKRLGVNYNYGESHRIGANYDIDAKSISLSYGNSFLHLNVISDSLNWKRAKALGIELIANYRL